MKFQCRMLFCFGTLDFIMMLITNLIDGSHAYNGKSE